MNGTKENHFPYLIYQFSFFIYLGRAEASSSSVLGELVDRIAEEDDPPTYTKSHEQPSESNLEVK